MRDGNLRIRLSGIIASVLLPLLGASARADTPPTVTIGGPSTLPSMCHNGGQTSGNYYVKKYTDPTFDDQYCTIQSRSFTFSASVSPGGALVVIDPNTGDLTFQGFSPGTYTITVTVTGTWQTDNCGAPTATDSMTTTVYVVQTTFNPSPVFVCVGCSTPLTANINPPAASSDVSFNTADTSVATVSGNAPNLTVTGTGNGMTQVCAVVGGKCCEGDTVDVNVAGVKFTPYRAGDFFGQAVSDAVKQGGNPQQYVLLTNNSNEANERSTAMAKIILQGVTPPPSQGTLSISVGSAVQVYQADGVTVLNSSDWSVDLSNPSGYLAGVLQGDLTLWLEGISTSSDLVFTYQYTNPNGDVVCKDTVHILVAEYTLQSQGGAVNNVSLAPAETLLILGGVTPYITPPPEKPDLGPPPPIAASAQFKIQVNALPTSAVTSLQVSSLSGSDTYQDQFDPGSSTVSKYYATVYDGDLISRPDQTGIIMANLQLNVVQGTLAQAQLVTLMDQYTRKIDTVFIRPQPSQTPVGGRILVISQEGGTTATLTSSNSTPSGGSSSWVITQMPDGANVSTSGVNSDTFSFTTDLTGWYEVTLTYEYNGKSTSAVIYVWIIPPLNPSSGAQGAS